MNKYLTKNINLKHNRRVTAVISSDYKHDKLLHAWKTWGLSVTSKERVESNGIQIDFLNKYTIALDLDKVG